jgi:hypothetical protein
MFVPRKPTRIITAGLVAGVLGGACLAPAGASARLWDTEFLPIYTLNSGEKGRVCGSFGGTISYSDGYRVNCSTGDVYYSGPTA